MGKKASTGIGTAPLRSTAHSPLSVVISPGRTFILLANEFEEESLVTDDAEKTDEHAETSDDGVHAEAAFTHKDTFESLLLNNGSNSGGSSINSGSNGESNSEGGDSLEGGILEDI